MPMYKYRGRNATGALVNGERESATPESLGTILLREGITPININLAAGTSASGSISSIFKDKKVKPGELALFTRQMYTLSKAGVPIIAAIKHLSGSSRSLRMKEVLLGVAANLEAGQNLASAMENYPDVFSNLIIGMVRVGQDSGRLEIIFERLTGYLELESETIKRVKAALRYPIMVLVAITVGIIIINMFVIPTFSKVYVKAGIPLPKITLILIAISNFFVNYWMYMLGASIGAGFYLYRYIHTTNGRFKWDRLQLRLPIVGRLLQRLVLLRFAQTFGIIVNSGVPINQGLTLVSQAVDNQFARNEILNMQLAIQRGSSITQAAYNCRLFSGIELQMLSVSEETGELGTMLGEIALYYEREVDYDIKRLTATIEPVMLIAISVMVLLMALAVYMPIWNMVKLAHKG